MNRIGVHSFSFAPHIWHNKLTPWAFIADISKLPYHGVELIGSQVLPDYPVVSQAVIEATRQAMNIRGVQLLCFDTYLDRGLYADREASHQELFAAFRRDAELARGLGVERIRTGFITPQLVELLLPVLNEFDLELVIELHDARIIEERVQELMAYLAVDGNSQKVGLLQDFGAFVENLPGCWVEDSLRRGLSERDIDLIDEAWRSIDDGPRLTLPENLVGPAQSAFNQFVRTPVDALREAAPFIRHVHAKFYRMENGEEPSIPYGEIMPILLDAGYSGPLVSEYVGWQWHSEDTFEQIAAHQQMLSSYITGEKR